jgi:hypothetical protein
MVTRPYFDTDLDQTWCSYFSVSYLSNIVELLSLGLVESREYDIGISLYKLMGILGITRGRGVQDKY